MGTGSFPGVKSGQGVTLTHHPLLVPWSRKSRAVPVLPLWAVRPVQSLSACTVELYLYSPYRPYSLYRVSVPVQYSYTSTPLSACTVQLYLYSPQCLYSTAIRLLPLWAVRPVQSLSACTSVHFTLPYFRLGVKVKWSRYRPGVAQRMGRGISLLFHDRGPIRGWVVSSTPRPQFTPG